MSWFYLEQGEYLELSPDAKGILQSRIFPGLWLAVSDLLAGNMQQLLTVLQAGLQSPECSVFTEKLSNK
ncbi:hypothetical protein [Floridanema fluviatile]|uniref:hypothetical protein n=1 Tax=Floridanema fluviatile TaxID=3396171 RepID=UPI0039A5F5C4